MLSAFSKRCCLPSGGAQPARFPRKATVRCLVFLSLGFVACCSLLGASGGDSRTDADWQSVSPREELRPSFERLSAGGPSGLGSLIIRADEREGLDGHW